jgi:hypothetical protein
MSLSALGVPAPVAAPIAAGVGIYQGLKSGGGGRQSQANQASLAISRERLNLERERFAEQLRVQSVRDVEHKEQILARSIQAGAQINRANIQPQLDRFRVRPTFASRIGLVDAVERELASALKPRW